MAVDDFLAVRLAVVDLKASCPHHAALVLEGVGDVEVHAGMDEDVFLQLDVRHAIIHPVDVLLGYLARMLHAEACQGGLGAHGLPFLLLGMFAEKTFLLVGLKGLHAHVLVVALDEMHFIFLLLQVHQVVNDAFAVGTTVDVVAKEIELVVLRDFEHVFEQHLQGFGAAVNIRDDPAS